MQPPLQSLAPLVRAGTATHMIWTLQVPVVGHRRGSLVGWREYIDPFHLQGKDCGLRTPWSGLHKAGIANSPEEWLVREPTQDYSSSGKIRTVLTPPPPQSPICLSYIPTVTRSITTTTHPPTTPGQQAPNHPAKVGAPFLTSMWQKDRLAFRLHLRLIGVRGRQCHTALTGMELAVDLCAGPGQSLTIGKEKKIWRNFLPSTAPAPHCVRPLSWEYGDRGPHRDTIKLERSRKLGARREKGSREEEKAITLHVTQPRLESKCARAPLCLLAASQKGPLPQH